MTNTTVAGFVLSLIMFGCSQEPPPAGEETSDPSAMADVVYANGRIYTVDEERPWAEAVAVKDGRFLVVGSAEEAASVVGTETESVDLGGAFVMPGVFDLHSHPFITPWYGSMNLELTGLSSKEEILAAVAGYAQEHPDKERRDK